MKARAQGRDAPRACMRASCGAVRRESSAVRPQWAKMWRRLKHRCRKYSRPAPSLPSRIERKPLFCVRPSLKRGCPVILSADAHHPRQKRRYTCDASLPPRSSRSHSAPPRPPPRWSSSPSRCTRANSRPRSKSFSTAARPPKRSSSPTSASARTNAARSYAS